MKQEPVAWIVSGDLRWDYDLVKKGRSEEMMNDLIPLYTAPRELSDEEIIKTIKEWAKEEFKDDFEEPEDSDLTLMLSMSKAILKKASE